MKAIAIATVAIAFALAFLGAAHAAETITGCLSGPDAQGAYRLTRAEEPKEVNVTGARDLGRHVGHEVSLTGDWSAKGEDGGPADFTAVTVRHISTNCPKN
jgi:hypothetical protein